MARFCLNQYIYIYTNHKEKVNHSTPIFTYCLSLQVLGANGRFEDVNREGNVVVTIDRKNWTFNPVCIMPLDTENASAKIPPIQAETSTTRPINQTSVSVNG